MWNLGRSKQKNDLNEEESLNSDSEKNDEFSSTEKRKNAESKRKKRNSRLIVDSDESDSGDDKKKRSRSKSKRKSKRDLTKNDTDISDNESSARTKKEKKKKEKKSRSTKPRQNTNKVFLKASELDFQLDKNDLEQRNLLSTDRIKFIVGAVNPFAKGPLYSLEDLDADNESKKNKKGEELFQESVHTGHFKRIYFKLDEEGNRLYRKSDKANEATTVDNSPEYLRKIVKQVEYILSAFFLVCEGILSGAAMFELIVVFQISNEATFLQIYAPIALELRRLFYFLSVLAFVGACEKYTTEREQNKLWMERDSREKSELFLYVFFYFLCLLFTLLAGPISDEMGNTYHAGEFDDSNDDAWVKNILSSSNFDLVKWRWLITFRFASGLLGWFLLCKDIHRDLSRSRELQEERKHLEHQLELSNVRLQNMSGVGLDKLSTSQLEHILQSTRIGSEESQLQLKIREGNDTYIQDTRLSVVDEEEDDDDEIGEGDMDSTKG